MTPGRDERTDVCDTPHWGLLSQGGSPGHPWPYSRGTGRGASCIRPESQRAVPSRNQAPEKLDPLPWGSSKESCHPSKSWGKESLAKQTNKHSNRLGIWICGTSKLKNSHDNRSGTAKTQHPPQTLTCSTLQGLLTPRAQGAPWRCLLKARGQHRLQVTQGDQPLGLPPSWMLYQRVFVYRKKKSQNVNWWLAWSGRIIAEFLKICC